MSIEVTKWLHGIWGSSSTDVFAVGYPGQTIPHYDGSTWSLVDSRTADSLWNVWGTSSTDVFGVGYFGTILHYDGTRWSSMETETSEYVYGVWGSSPINVFAVGGSGTALRYDGQRWSPMETGTSTHLYGMWGSSETDVFAVGYGGSVFHYNGDADGDGLVDSVDNCPAVYNPEQGDSDGDGIGDACDECAPSEYTSYGWACGGDWNPETCCSGKCGIYSPAPLDVYCIDDASDIGEGACNWGDGWYVYDGYSDATSTCCNGTKKPGSTCDSDGDGIPDDLDNCPAIPNPDQTDTDGDGKGDVCEGLGDLDCDNTFTGTDVLIEASLVVDLITCDELPSCIPICPGDLLATTDWDCSGSIDGTDVLIGASIIVDIITEGDTPLGQGCL
jgi:hypothetical protein